VPRYVQIELEYFEKNIVGECVDGHLLAELVCKALAQKSLQYVYGKFHSLILPSTEKSSWHRAASSPTLAPVTVGIKKRCVGE